MIGLLYYTQKSLHTITALGQLSVTVDSTTVSPSPGVFPVANRVVDSYEVMWERTTCPDDDVEEKGNTTITGGSTSLTIMELEEDSAYTITVTASNIGGSIASGSVSGVTNEIGKIL